MINGPTKKNQKSGGETQHRDAIGEQIRDQDPVHPTNLCTDRSPTKQSTMPRTTVTVTVAVTATFRTVIVTTKPPKQGSKAQAV